MPRRPITVTVSQPCHEDWLAMTPQAKGRFCKSCQKTVVDFTKMSDCEIAQWFSKQTGNSCGRFRTTQLGKELLAKPSTRQNWTWRAAALAITAWLSTKATEAQPISSGSTIEQNTQSKNTKSTLSKPERSITTDSLAIKGIVLDSATNSPIPGALVVLKDIQTGVITNSRGEFDLKIPSDLQIEQQKIQVAFIGLVTQELSLRDLIMRDNVVINLAQEHSVLTGEVLVVNNSPEWYTPRGLYYRIRNLLH